MKIWGIIAVFVSLAGPAWAEYRLYQYLIKPRQMETVGSPPQAYLTISSLDPISYQSYHGGTGIQEIGLLRSWMCMGHTGGKESCLAPLDLFPKEPVPTEAPTETPPSVPILAPSS